jgi:hypothetical protein
VRNAYPLTDYGEAKAALYRLWRQLSEVNPSAVNTSAACLPGLTLANPFWASPGVVLCSSYGLVTG